MTPSRSLSAQVIARPVIAGIVTALVGFTSSFAVVLAGLHAVGATESQAASGLLALTLAFGLGAVFLSWTSRLPVTLAWSTPGAALLAGSTGLDGGWPAAVGAFLLTGVLFMLTGLVPALGQLLRRIPAALAQAMLAGVLLPLCLQPFTALASVPLLVIPVLVLWLLLTVMAPRWAVPAAFVLALAGIVLSMVIQGHPLVLEHIWPELHWTTPRLTVQAVVGVALPLFVVTMASQNVPGVAVLASFGYQTPWRPAMLVTGVGTALAAPWGGHAINLAALSAALTAGEEAGPDRRRRWIAAFTSGWAYLLLAGCSALLVAVISAGPRGVIEAVAGLALMSTLIAALSRALQEPSDRIPAAITLLLAASGISFAGIGAAFWALVIGLLVRWLFRRTTRRSGL
ncbi:benzoate/H(+) symporter BenE family transporter [Psychromicrobium xiongbiense]|uniref:benzoate/H(+) symporter BenE family transporter n=1 Tax=Psychromicrobium xiongbiense TaxID=3051184 RepID=UPI002553F239|nr:benzoate/H(+) symporter BenE family transporter [Psychromicrobium sp. YIM S02556]